MCEFKRRNCDDGKICTIDSCHKTEGCKHTFDSTISGCDTPKCSCEADCAEYAKKANLAEKCQEAICCLETGTCKAVLQNNPKCNPFLNKCKNNCVARNKCESARCVIDAQTKQYSCERIPIICEDGNSCTKDFCDPLLGCSFKYLVSEKCPKYCENNVDCIQYGASKGASENCQVSVCDKKTTSCVLQKDPNPNCKEINCKKSCKANNACDVPQCQRKTPDSNEISCTHLPRVCDDHKTCTVDSCDHKNGCEFKFKYSDTCVKPCDKDLDCVSWGVASKLENKCQLAVCDQKSGSCKAIKGPQTSKCSNNEECKCQADCPQGKFGTICCEENSVRKCCDHQCKLDSDCLTKSDSVWGYCVTSETGRKVCEYKDKCKNNSQCDDKNPCTKDVCLTEYGFCKHLPHCNDNTECTEDICVPSKDKKTYHCEFRKKTCSKLVSMLDKNFQLLTKKEQNEWLGQCSELTGCITCSVNAQCEDNNGCTEDSCVNQFCVHKPINNKWCDPTLVGLPLKLQAYMPNKK